MPTLSELTLFKKCVENPIVAPIEQLNLENISSICEDKAERHKKKAMKLYHMFWTSLTKYLSRTVLV